ncbi:hypothetical protein DY000_02020190 [Brassica cretica]|uniref:Uncharacterized protein n=1 Tax=Brassica cretica TaxID=69181 RepID=A0ABQ7EDL7_BRACR|nr:hypothetical protein DY000_02020190 [Brassica cretica]
MPSRLPSWMAMRPDDAYVRPVRLSLQQPEPSDVPHSRTQRLPRHAVPGPIGLVFNGLTPSKAATLGSAGPLSFLVLDDLLFPA